MNLYVIARRYRTARAVLSGNPRRIGRRAKNVIVGRALARAGVFRWLWK